jgi:hypothetical protein
MKLIFLVALIPLLVLAPSLSYASVTPDQHKCIQDKMGKLESGIMIGLALDNSPKMIATVGKTIANYTGSIEGCLK